MSKMMKNTFFIKNILAITILLMALSAIAEDSVMLFSVSNIPFTSNSTQINPCYLNFYHSILNRINYEIKTNKNITASNIVKLHKRDFMMISHSYLCQYQAKKSGVTKLPAIVFNHHYVIYGVSDVMQAKRFYRDFLDN